MSSAFSVRGSSGVDDASHVPLPRPAPEYRRRAIRALGGNIPEPWPAGNARGKFKRTQADRKARRQPAAGAERVLCLTRAARGGSVARGVEGAQRAVLRMFVWGNSMRRVVAGLLALMAGAQAAAAADLPIGPPPRQPIVLFTWDGFYIGVHGGGAWTHKDESGVPFQVPQLGNATITPQAFTLDASGPLAGIQAGINFQFGMWVVGAEAQASWSNLNASAGCNSFSTTVVAITATCDVRVDTIATFALRLGVAFDRLLLFGKAGVGIANDRYTSNWNGPPGFALIFDANETRWGWMAGIGIEYAFFDSWSAKIEYDHIDLGSRTERWTDSANVIFYVANVRQTVDLVKFGINYRFGVNSIYVR
jgi:outer membrane immunogenic protein